MYLIYNSVALHTIASTADGRRHLVVVGPTETWDPPEHPQRKQVQLRAVLDLFATGVDTMQAKLTQLRTALAQQHAVLQYRNPESGEYYVNRSAAVLSLDPGDETLGVPVGSGVDPTMHRQVTIVFGWEVPLDETQAANIGGTGGATFTPAGGAAVALPNILDWTESLRQTRPNLFKPGRNLAVQSLNVRGWIQVPIAAGIDSRRAEMLTKRAQLAAALESDEGTLVRATDPSWKDGVVVKIEEATVVVNEASNRIEYSFTASRVKFPETGNFDTGEITVTGTAGRDSGQITLTLSGRVQASTYARAVTRKDAMLANVMAGYYGESRRTRVRLEQTINYVSTASAPVSSEQTLSDGFTEVQFREDWLVFASETIWKGDITLRYVSTTSRDLLSLDEGRQIEGDLYATAAVLNAVGNRSAGNYLDAFIGALSASGGWSTTRDERSLSREALQAAGWTTGVGVTLTDDAPQSIRFTVAQTRAITGDDALLECRLKEDVTYSGARVVEHEMPDGPSVLQTCGTTSASRTVSGMVRSASLAAALAWANGKRLLLSAAQDPVEDEAVELPPTRSIDYEWASRPASAIADPDREGAGPATVKIHVVNFTYGERMPELTLEV